MKQAGSEIAITLGGGFGISKNQDTFILMCSNASCLYRENLNQLVNRLGDDEMKKKWWELSFGARPSKKTSDQDVPQMSKRDLWRTAMSGGYIDPNHPLVRKLMRNKNKGDG